MTMGFRKLSSHQPNKIEIVTSGRLWKETADVGRGIVEKFYIRTIDRGNLKFKTYVGLGNTTRETLVGKMLDLGGYIEDGTLHVHSIDINQYAGIE